MRGRILSLGVRPNRHRGGKRYGRALEGSRAPLVAFSSPDGTTDGDRPTEPCVPKPLHLVRRALSQGGT